MNELAVRDADRLVVEFVGRVRTDAGDDGIEVRGLDVAEEMGLTRQASSSSGVRSSAGGWR